MYIFLSGGGSGAPAAMFRCVRTLQIFKDSLRPSHPMASFTTIAAGLAAAEGVNSCLFFARLYSSQGMLMFER